MAAPYSGQKCAAIITCVHSDRMVNLFVLDPNANPFKATSVSLHQPEDNLDFSEEDLKAGRYCEWMEYQKGQAAKTEELEAKLGA